MGDPVILDNYCNPYGEKVYRNYWSFNIYKQYLNKIHNQWPIIPEVFLNFDAVVLGR